MPSFLASNPSFSTTFQTCVTQDVPSEGIIAISGGNGALGLVMGTWLLTRAEQQVKASVGAYKPNFSIQSGTRSEEKSHVG